MAAWTLRDALVAANGMLALPISFMTMGLIGFVINAGLLLLTAFIANTTGFDLTVGDFPPDLLSANADGLHVLVEDPALAERLREAFGQRLWLEIIRPGPGNRSRHANAQREAALLEGGNDVGALAAGVFASSPQMLTTR
jgi:hypothetical protein